MLLEKVASLKLIPTTPFDFDSTFHKPDHFTAGDNGWEPGTRWQTWRWQGRPLGLKFVNSGTVDQPKLRVDVFDQQPLDDAFRAALADEIRYRYNLSFDLTDFYRAFDGDPVLGPVIRRWRGIRPGHPNALYEYLIIGIVLQNATVRRSIQMFKALVENYGTGLEFDGRSLWCFWEPGAFTGIEETELRRLQGKKRAKIKEKPEQSGQTIWEGKANG